MSRKIFVLLLGLLVLGAMASSMLGSREPGMDVPAALVGTVFMQPRPLDDFQLEDHTGARFDRTRLAERWTLVFFGYTSCPDICPTTMHTLSLVDAAVAVSGGEQPQVVMVSVDPERDSAEALSEYVSYFGEGFIGVRGEEMPLHQLTLQAGAMYELGEPDETGFYDVAHSASIFLIDPQVRVVAAFSPPHQPERIASDLEAIRALFAGN